MRLKSGSSFWSWAQAAVAQETRFGITASGLLLGALVAAQAAQNPRARWYVAVSSAPISLEVQAELAGKSKTQAPLSPALVSSTTSEQVVSAIPKDDPQWSSLMRTQELLSNLKDVATARESLASLAISSGDSGKEMKSLILANYPKLTGVDNPEVRLSLVSSYRVETKSGDEGVFWDAVRPSPPESPLIMSREGKQNATFTYLSGQSFTTTGTSLYVPYCSADKKVRAAAIGKAIENYESRIGQLRAATDTMTSNLFRAVADAQGAGGLAKFTNKDLTFGEIPKALQNKVAEVSPDTAANFRKTDALRMQPYLIFSMRGRDHTGKLTTYSIGIRVPNIVSSDKP